MSNLSLNSAGLLPGLFLILIAPTLLVGCGKKTTPDKSTAKTGNTSLPKEASDAAKKPRTKSDSTPAVHPEREVDTTPIDLVDVAKERGIDFQYHADMVPGRFLIVESMGGTMAWFDFDKDGAQDLYLLNGNKIAAPTDDLQNQLFRNVGGSFRQVEQSGTGDVGYGFGVAIGDFDVDGFPDIYVTNYGPNALFRNNGDGTFSSATTDVLANADWGTGCVWFDANGDRLPDLFVGNYGEVTIASSKVCQYNGQPGYCGPNQLPPQKDRVFVNNGDGSFSDNTDALGFAVEPVYSLGVVAVDLNDDAFPELIAARDLTPNGLFVKGQSGVWSDQGVAAGVSASGDGKLEAGMGIACADFDGDHSVDFMLTHYYERKNTLYRNLGDLVFADDSYRSRIAAASMFFLGFGTSVLDINRDSAPDIFVTNGHVLGPNHNPCEMSGQMLLNNGKGRFLDISDRCGPYFKRKLLGRGSATVDFDNDGDCDIGVGHCDQPFTLLEDRMPNPNWIGLDIVSPDRCGTAGGHVVVQCGEINRRLPLLSGGSYLCVSDSRLRLALPSGSESVNVTVVFPGGAKRELKGLGRNQYWTVTSENAEPTVW